jgi:hypothetical protein
MRNSVGQSRGSRPHRCIHSTERLIVLITVLPKKRRCPFQDDNPGGDPLTERRADFGFSGGASTISSVHNHYLSKWKEKYYQRFLDIKTTDRCAIFFFAVLVVDWEERRETM